MSEVSEVQAAGAEEKRRRHGEETPVGGIGVPTLWLLAFLLALEEDRVRWAEG